MTNKAVIRVRSGTVPSAALALALLGQGAAQAQTASTNQTESRAPTTNLDEVIVTAQRREQRLTEVPMSIVALSSEQLFNRGVTDVQSLAKVTPGLSFVESGNGVPVYSLRGVGFFETSLGARPTVSVYLDEVSLPFSAMSAGAALDLQRVEVLKGPQGTLYGQNATGGAINYVAAKPTAEPMGGATIGYSSFNTFEASGYASGPLSDTLGARLAFRAVHGGDWQESYTRDDSLGKRRFIQGRVLLDWTPSDTLSFAVNVNGFIDRSDTQAAQLTVVLPQTPSLAGRIPLLTAYPRAPEDNRAADWNANEAFEKDNSFGQASLRGELELTPELLLTSLTSYSKMDVSQRIDQDGTSLTTATSAIKGTLSAFAQEVRLSGDYGPANFVAGLVYSDDRAEERNLLSLPYSTIASTLPTGGVVPSILSNVQIVSDQRFQTQAAFASLDYDFTPEFIAHAGVRFTHSELEYDACNRAADAATAATTSAFFNLLRRGSGRPLLSLASGDCVSVDATTTPGSLVGTLEEDNTSWRVGLDWKPASQTLVYANISRGFKSGSVPTPPAVSTAAFRPVTQESVLAYEIGFKAPIIPSLVEASGAVFYYDYSDKQLLGRVFTTPSALGALQALVNVPESRVQGAELQLNAFPLDGLTISLAGTYLDSQVTAPFVNFTITAVQADFNGNAFPYTPEVNLVGDVQYEFPVSGDLVGQIGANISYRSDTTAGFGDVALLGIDGYSLVDLRASLRAPDRRWQVSAFVRNVADTYYWNNVARLTDTVRRFAGQPRTVGVQLNTRF